MKGWASPGRGHCQRGKDRLLSQSMAESDFLAGWCQNFDLAGDEWNSHTPLVACLQRAYPEICFPPPAGGRAGAVLLEQRVHHEPDQRQCSQNSPYHVPGALQEFQEPLEQVGPSCVSGQSE